MYIGCTDQRGLHHLVYEVVDNCVDEALAGDADRIEITIHEDGTVTVSDNGRGIPVDIHPKTGRPALETVMTVLHAGGKFGGGGYKVACGPARRGRLARSTPSPAWLRVDVRRDGKVYRQEYERGVPTMDVTVVGEAEETGTTTTFLPDKTIFSTLDYSFDALLQRFREMAYLTKGLTFVCKDERADRECTFYFEGGIVSFVRHLNKNRAVLHPKPIYVEKRVNGTYVEVALQYNDGYAETVFSFANNINTVDGGTHLTGFRSGAHPHAERLRPQAGRAQGGRRQPLRRRRARGADGHHQRQAGGAAVREPDQGQAGQRRGAHPGGVGAWWRGCTAWLEENPAEAKKIIEKCLTAARAREAARRARDLVIRKSAAGGHDPARQAGRLLGDATRPSRELYIVEGDSAGGTAKQGRDRRFQAILPLRGKILNVEKARADKMLATRGDPGPHHRPGHRRRRPLRRRQAALLAASSS